MWGFLEKLRYPMLALFLGAVLAVLAYFQVSTVKGLTLTPLDRTRLPLLVIGVSVIVASLVGAAASVQLDNPFRFGSASVHKAGEGFVAEVGQSTLAVMFGRVEDIANPVPTSLTVLPANEFFDDECITDTRSALGAFMAAKFAGQTREVEAAITEALGGKPTTRVEREAGRMVPSYGIGTCVFLDRVKSAYRILLVAVTTHRAGMGLRAEVTTLFRAVEQAYCIAVDRRIDEVTVPLLGSGHGCLGKEVALFALLLAWVERLCQPNGPRITVRIVVFRASPGVKPQIARGTVRRLLRDAVGMFQ
jgi:hypothetical protein